MNRKNFSSRRNIFGLLHTDFLDLCGEAEEGGETHDDLIILLIL